MSLKCLLKVISISALLLSSAALYAQDLTGAGASFPAPVYAKWADTYYKQTGNKVNYQSIGSSAGVKQIVAGTVDFGASDAPLTDEELAKNGLVQFPTVIGGVVPVVNIKGIDAGQLKLTGAILADIYLGKVTQWNDKTISDLNPNLSLPKDKIIVVRRADGSGTSFVFTSYLNKVSANWAQEVGVSTAVKWPVGVGGKGNEGVSAYVMRLPNSIGYVEYAYAKQNKLAYVSLENAAGKFVLPTEDTFKAATKGIDWAKTFAQDMTNAPGDETWPLTTATYILLHKQPANSEQSAGVLRFFNWAFNQGEQEALALDYVAFPNSVKEVIRHSWSTIIDNNGKGINY